MALTTLKIKALKPKETPYRVADSGGLCLEVSVAGGKLWRWRYRFNGKAQLLALGKWPETSLEQARKARDDARTLLRAGKHPSREKKANKLRASAASDNTFETVARNWMTIKSTKLNRKYAEQSLRRIENHVLPHIGALPISEITIPDVVRVVEKVGERGTIETARWVTVVKLAVCPCA